MADPIPDPPQATWWNPFSWGAAQEHSDTIDQRRTDLNNQRAEVYGYDWLSQTQAQTASGRVDVAGDILDEFDAESLGGNLKESADKASGAISSGLNTVGGFVWNSLPWWIWVAGLIVLFIYAGGGVWLRGILVRKGAS